MIKALSKLGLHHRYKLRSALEGFDFTPWVEGEGTKVEGGLKAEE